MNLKYLEIKLPRILKVISKDRAKRDLDSQKYIAILIPIEDIKSKDNEYEPDKNAEKENS